MVQAKQDVYSIKIHDNLRQKTSVYFFSLMFFEAIFCVEEKAKTSN